MNPLADTIIDRLRTCKTAGDIHSVADHYRADVVAMKGTARYHHIVNAKAYYLEALRNDQA